jgi:glycosyltransferase involved in cell wall biosynthesis
VADRSLDDASGGVSVAAALVTLIVPTYRRPADLLRCLRSVQLQTLADFELVVVDNAADLELRAQLDAFNVEARIPARYVPEAQLGLHNARHAGVRAASGDVLAFTDDDATFDPCWLAAHAAAFAEHSDMLAAGGPIRPVWEVAPPDWLLRFMALTPDMFPVLSLLDLAEDFRLERDGLFFGVNMAVRRDALNEAGGFNPDSFGPFWLGDGESGLMRRLWELGGTIGYLPNALVWHHVPPERMTPAYFRRRQANDGAGDIYCRYHHAGVPGSTRLLLDVLDIVRGALRDWLAAPLFWNRTDPRSLRVQMRTARSLAQVGYLVRLMHDRRLRTLVERQDWLHNASAA